jgi:hypothetical protein
MGYANAEGQALEYANELDRACESAMDWTWRQIWSACYCIAKAVRRPQQQQKRYCYRKKSRASGTEKEVKAKGSAGAAFLEPNRRELLPGRATD